MSRPMARSSHCTNQEGSSNSVPDAPLAPGDAMLPLLPLLWTPVEAAAARRCAVMLQEGWGVSQPAPCTHARTPIPAQQHMHAHL